MLRHRPRWYNDDTAIAPTRHNTYNAVSHVAAPTPCRTADTTVNDVPDPANTHAARACNVPRSRGRSPRSTGAGRVRVRIVAAYAAVMPVITGSDGLARTPWAYANDRMRDYYDTEWGMPVTDERGLFERLSLEAFQAGLSWDVILRKRDDFRRVFHDFDPDRVAAFTDADVENALADAGIVRNRAKISATVGNARAVGKLRGEEFPLHPRLGTIPAGLPQLIWSHLPERTPEPATSADVPTTSAESTALAKALKKRGFRFVGPTSAHALMEAIGMIDTHVAGSWRRGCSGLWG